jgi:ferric-dicitrate binding protein FerR (iron transport regulator)
VLSSQEQQVWDDVQRFWAEVAEEPPLPAPRRTRRASRDGGKLPSAVIAGAWITIMLVIFGAVVAGLSVGVATGLGWALWHHWPRLKEQGALCTSPKNGSAHPRIRRG